MTKQRVSIRRLRGLRYHYVAQRGAWQVRRRMLVKRWQVTLLTPAAKLWILISLTIPVAVLTWVEPPIAQDQSYHNFADVRPFEGIPNFLNVASNVGFLIVGLWGLNFLWTQWRTAAHPAFIRRREMWPYLVLFLGLACTSWGSAYYHLHPDDTHLVWDRLPMTIGFMSIFAITIIERISYRWGLWLLGPLVAAGVGSVIYWYWGDLRGHGDLRLYVDVQFYPMLAVPLIIWFFPSSYTYDRLALAVVGLYGLSKLFEVLDWPLFALLGQVVSGHTLKHLTAAVATYIILWMLHHRHPQTRQK